MRRFVKLAFLAATCVVALVMVFLFVMMTGVFDIVESTYPSKDDALRDGALDRLLPSFIPQSATNISLKYNTDVAVMNGTFDFRSEDFREFVDTVRSSDDGRRCQGVGVLREEQLLQEGYQVYDYNHGRTFCRFLIHPKGRCTYAAAGPYTAKEEWAKSSLPTGRSSTITTPTTSPDPAAGL